MDSWTFIVNLADKMLPEFPILDPESTKTFLSDFLAPTCERGDAILNEGRVHNLVCDVPQMRYRALVMERLAYQVHLTRSGNGKWEGVCACQAANKCKHLYAVMRALLARRGGAALEQARVKGRSTKAAKRTALAVEAPPPGKLGAILSEKIGRPLTYDEMAFTKTFQALWDRLPPGGWVTCADLRLIGFPLVQGKAWDRVQVSPKNGADVVIFWNQVAAWAVGEGMEIPPFMEPVTSAEPFLTQYRKWRRSLEVANWQSTLKQIAASGTVIPRRLTEIRVRLLKDRAELECRYAGEGEFAKIKLNRMREIEQNDQSLAPESERVFAMFSGSSRFVSPRPEIQYSDNSFMNQLGQALRVSWLASWFVTERGEPLVRIPDLLRWNVSVPETAEGDYSFELVSSDGTLVSEIHALFDGHPALYLTEAGLFQGPGSSFARGTMRKPVKIPAAAVESTSGVSLFRRLEMVLPERIEARTRLIPILPLLRAEIATDSVTQREICRFEVIAMDPDSKIREKWGQEGWMKFGSNPQPTDTKQIVIEDRSTLERMGNPLTGLGVSWDWVDRCWKARITRNFPQLFSAWLQSLPPEAMVELRGELASFLRKSVAGDFKLDVEENGIDWFDLEVIVNVDDTTLTPDEIKALLSARGKWVRLSGKGWRKLEFKVSAEDEEQLSRLGLSTNQLDAGKQRLHALQLADPAAKRFLGEEQFERVQRRAKEIQARVTPEIPIGVSAELRPYQRDGFHFLAYLATNRFGGILADDMGLGKTLQALTWLTWVRAQPGGENRPSLVVCPKSVTDNWRSEAERFTPGLRTRVWKGQEIQSLPALALAADLHVINYAQMRLIGEDLARTDFLAVILDEGQFIKNPSSQTALTARFLRAEHRLVLSGTPIENRLLDLWSLLAFAMPGVLGRQAQFQQLYDSKNDPFARQRLAARVRPFLLRRTKLQVARDLPDRVEEDLYCELEGEQKLLYRAELKRAQAMLLKATTAESLNSMRFNVLTSLLRLRQICCDPRLVKPEAKGTGAKLEALIDHLEPLIDKGEKVLVFSQFVEMLELLRQALHERGWKLFHLDGSTENRGELVKEFQNAEGAAVFLISLKAGGFGLNLTAASYVVLFDPWWNPAVENQAIDRTHRIGQSRNVFAHRLLIKDSIEEKIRALQKRKKALSDDVFGEERFASALTLDDLRFLFAD
ncbi:MAG: DEAD/DEAH box helicase [Pedosphaera sp.]|nr:DEAD/DEAH box helicase [Pedosphaera sp.]